MKKLILLALLIVSLGATFAVKYNPDYFVARSVIVCFTRDAVGKDTGKIDYIMRNGHVRTGMASFDVLAAEYQIVEMQQMHPYVKDPTWNDHGIYLQNTYRLILNSDERIDDAVAALAQDPNLVYAELEGIARSKFVPNDPMLNQQYVHARVRSYEAWDYVQGSRDVKVAITDSGVKWNHPDLRANIWVNPAEAPGMAIDWDAGTISGGDNLDAGEGGGKKDDLVGWDFFNSDNNPIQTYAANDHGTHVAGCAGAVGNNAIGVVGTSPNVSIISCKGASNTSPSDGISFAYDQIKYAAEVGADIINASWGSPGSGTYPNSIVNYATSLGALVVTAAGNDNLEHNATYQDYPADCTNALCVASTGQGDIKSNFSDYGAAVDVCAPGEGIVSTIIGGTGYNSYSGTSMSSPVVAGVCALVKSLNPELTPAELMQRVMDTADYIYDLNPNYEGKLGAGRVNAFAATMYDKIPYVTIEETTTAEVEGDGDGVANPGETLSLKISLNNYIDPYTGLAWLNASNLTATLTTAYPGVTITDSVAVYGNLSAGSTMWNNSHPFKFQTVSSLPSEPIPFELVVRANLDCPYPYVKTLPFTVNLSLVQAGWPVSVGGASASSPIIANLDSDPDKELVFAGSTGNLHAVKQDGTSLPGFPIITTCPVIGSLAMADVTNDGTEEFAACLQNGNIILFDQSGATLWSIPSGGNLRSGPVIADLAMNNQRKIIVVTQTGNLIVLNPDGSNYANFPVSLGAACLASPAIADLNGDGIHEIIVSTLNGVLHAINSATGQNISGFSVVMPGGSQNPITIANLDADDHPEILIATSTSGHVLAYNHDGTIHFQRTVGCQMKAGPVVADINNDGETEIVAIGSTGMINVLNPAGQPLPGTPINLNRAVECTPAIANFDGGNLSGIIFGDTNGYLHSVHLDGSESPNFPLRLNGNLKVSPALGDIDLDGDLDIALPNDTSFFVIDIKRGAQNIAWPCWLGTYNRAGNSYQPTPAEDGHTPSLTTGLKGNFPNPFNPSTSINFELASPGRVILGIYNPKGQLVRTLVDANLPAGQHQELWNGLDEHGAPVASGVYFYRMLSGKFSATRKMVLMK